MARILNASGAASALADPGDPVAASAVILEQALAALADGAAAQPDASTLLAVDPLTIVGDEARIAFWVNVYNALLLAVQRERPFRGSVLLSMRAFASYAFEIGGANYSLNLIEHGVLRRNRRSPSSPLKPLRRGDVRREAAPAELDPRIHFVLNCGARSCPPIRVFNAETAAATLELAARAYMQAETIVDADAATVELPGLLKLYSADFGDRAEQLRFAARYIPALDALLEYEPKPRVSHSAFDWRVHKPDRAPSS